MAKTKIFRLSYQVVYIGKFGSRTVLTYPTLDEAQSTVESFVGLLKEGCSVSLKISLNEEL